MELPVPQVFKTTAVVTFRPGEDPGVDLGGTPEPNFQAAMQAWLAALLTRKLPGSEVFPADKPIAVPKARPDASGIWRVEFGDAGVTLKATTVPILAVAWFVVSYLAGSIDGGPKIRS